MTAGDEELLARVADFWAVHREHQEASKAWQTRRAEVEAMPDCPRHAVPAFDRPAYERWEAFMKDKGATRLSNIANAANKRSGKAANAVFATPAQTIRGGVEKLKIARLASGIGEGTGTPPTDLRIRQLARRL